MKIRIVGGPAEGKVEVECDGTTNFAAIMVLAENSIGKGILHDKFHFYRGEIVDKKAKAVALVAPTDTPQSAGLPAVGALLVLKAKDGSPQSTPRNNDTSAVTKPKTPRSLTFRDRMIAMYEAYEPSKAGTVDGMLEKYKGKEEAVIKKLVEKYGPEPQPAAAPDVAPVVSPVAQAPRGERKKSPRERIIAIYQKYDPVKVSTVDATLEKFKGKEEAVIKKLIEKYGPEPVDEPPAAPAVPSTAAAAPAPSPAPAPTPVVVATPPPAEPAASPSKAAQVSTPTAVSSAPRSFRDRMIAIYELYEPAKVSTVDATISKYKGKEEAVIKKLIEKYGPEPGVEDASPPSEVPRTTSVSEGERERSKSIARSRAASVAPPKDAEQAEADAVAPSPARERALSTKPTANDHVPPEEDEPSEAATSLDNTAASPPTGNDPTTPRRDVSSPASEIHTMKTADPRFQALMANILGRVLDEANHHTLRKRFLVWMRHANEQKAEKLLAQGKWVKDTDGSYECVESSPPFKTPDLVAFLEENKGTSRYQVLSDSLSDALRVIVRKVNTVINPEATPVVPVTFKDDETTANHLAQCIQALEIGKESQVQLQSLQLKHTLVSQELEALRVAHAAALGRLAVTEPAVERSGDLKRQLEQVSAELDVSKKQCSKQDVEIKLLTTDLTKTNKDLDMERRGLPTNMEVIVRQKDHRLASLEQEISKLRLKVKQQQSTTTQQSLRIQELESDVALLERSRSLVPFNRRSANPTSPATARQWPSGGSPDLTQPKTFSQSLRASPRGFEWTQPGQSHAATTPGRSPSRLVPPIAISLIGLNSGDSGTEVSVSHDPSARLSRVDGTPPASSPHTSRDIRDLVVRSEILEQELNRPPPIEYVGSCPHCATSLTALKGGDGVAHRAFCFSCRRSFTFDELAEYSKPKSRLKSTR